MTEVVIDGTRYVPVDDKEREDLSSWITRFTLEGDLFWQERFQRDSGKGQWNEGMYGDGDERAPFFTEAFLYNLVGKDDARSILGIIRRLSKLSGVEYR